MKKVIYFLLLALIVFNTHAQRGLSVHGGYAMPTSNLKPDAGPFLFLKDAKSVGLDYSFGFKNKASGIKFSADYIMASTDKEGVAAFAKEMDIPYKTYNFTSPNPTGISIMAGPNIMLFAKSKRKKLPLIWLDLQAGAIYSKPQSLQFFSGQTTPSKEVKTSNISLVYSPTLTVNLIKTKKLGINAKVGYSNFGGLTFGVGVAEVDCRDIYCYRCKGKGCINY